MYELVMPSRNYFGVGALDNLGELIVQLEVKSVIIVTDHTLSQLGYLERVVQILQGAGLRVTSFDSLAGEPTLNVVNEAIELAKSHDCQAVVGLGGGSPMDLAKIVGLVLANGGVARDYMGRNKSSCPSVPLILINTTAGTGAELSRAYIISDNAGEKLIGRDDHVIATITINDPSVMVNLPASITGATGMDALTHATEAYVSQRRNGLACKLAQGAIELIFEHLRYAIERPRDLVHREAMTQAQTLAGMALGSAGVGLAHAIAHPLGAMKKVSHGNCVGFVLPYVVAWNATRMPQGYCDLARRVFPEVHDEQSEAKIITYLVGKYYELSQCAGTATLPNGIFLSDDDIEVLASQAVVEPNCPNNPVQPTVADVTQILDLARQGGEPRCLLG